MKGKMLMEEEKEDEEKKKEKMAEESRRWEGSAGKDKRQHTHTHTYKAERNEYYRLVGLCTDRVSISLFLRVFPFFSFSSSFRKQRQ